MRFRTKTILGVAFIELVLLAFLVNSALDILRESNEAELMHRAQLGGKLLAAAAKDAVISQDLATLNSLAEEAINTHQIDMLRIVDAQGVVLAELGDKQLLARPFHQEENINLVKDGTFHWASPVQVGGIVYGGIQVGVSISPLHILLKSAQRWAASIAALEMILVAIFSWLLGSYLVRQLKALQNATHLFASGDYSHRIRVVGDDELAQTAAAFNSMAERIGESHKLLQAENVERLNAQHQAEAAKNREEDRNEQLNVIFALSPDGFVSFDGARQVKYANPAFTKLTGLEKSEIIGLGEIAFAEKLSRSCSMQIHFPSISTLRHINAIDTSNGRSSHHKIELFFPVRRVLQVDLSESQSKSVSQILYFRDITSETEVDRMKSEFLSLAAHELRTPLTSILGYSELLLNEKIPDSLKEESLQVIHSQSKWLVKIIRDLVDLSRLESNGGRNFELMTVDCAELIHAALTIFPLPPGRSEVNSTLLTGIAVSVDHAKFQQALLNVLDNAYKYSKEGDVLLEMTYDYAQKRVGILIRDHGIGMTQSQIAHIFERFWRADTSGNIPGTGLGMCLVKEIFDIFNGSIEVASARGGGTQVSLWLPASTTEVAPL